MPTASNCVAMLMRAVVFPMPGNPTIIRCGLVRIETCQPTGTWVSVSPRSISTGSQTGDDAPDEDTGGRSDDPIIGRVVPLRSDRLPTTGTTRDSALGSVLASETSGAMGKSS